MALNFVGIPNFINTKCGCYSTFVFTLKLESVTRNTYFGLKRIVKSCVNSKQKLKFLHVWNCFHLLHKWEEFCPAKNHYILPAWRDFKNIFSRALFIVLFRPRMVISYTDCIFRVKWWLYNSHILCVLSIKLILEKLLGTLFFLFQTENSL